MEGTSVERNQEIMESLDDPLERTQTAVRLHEKLYPLQLAKIIIVPIMTL